MKGKTKTMNKTKVIIICTIFIILITLVSTILWTVGLRGRALIKAIFVVIFGGLIIMGIPLFLIYKRNR